MALFYTKHKNPTISELTTYSESLIFSYGYNLANISNHSYGTIWTQGKQFGQNVYTTTTSYDCYLPILVAAHYNGGYVTAYHSSSVLVNPGTGKFKAVNFDGDFNGNFGGNFDGNFSGDFNGEFDGTFSGTHTGDFDGNFSGDFSGEFDGTFSGTHTGDFNGEFDGNFNGTHTGDFNGNITGNGVLNGYVSSSYMTVISQKTDNVEYAVPFTPTASTANNSYLYRDDSNGIKYNPSTNTLKVDKTISNINMSTPLGGQLTVAGVNIGQIKDKDVIPADITLYDLFKKMLCNEIDVVAQNPTVSLSFNPSSISFDASSGIGNKELTYTITLTDGRFNSADTTNWDGKHNGNIQYAGCKIDKYKFYNGNTIDITNATTITGKITISYPLNTTKTHSYSSITYFTNNANIPYKNTGEESSVSIQSNNITKNINITTTPKFYAYMNHIDILNAESIVNVVNSADKKQLPVNEISEWTSAGNKNIICICIPANYKLEYIYNSLGTTQVTSSFTTNSITINGIAHTAYIYENTAQLKFTRIKISKI